MVNNDLIISQQVPFSTQVNILDQDHEQNNPLNSPGLIEDINLQPNSFPEQMQFSKNRISAVPTTENESLSLNRFDAEANPSGSVVI